MKKILIFTVAMMLVGQAACAQTQKKKQERQNRPERVQIRRAVVARPQAERVTNEMEGAHARMRLRMMELAIQEREMELEFRKKKLALQLEEMKLRNDAKKRTLKSKKDPKPGKAAVGKKGGKGKGGKAEEQYAARFAKTKEQINACMFMTVVLVVNILLAVWVYTDIRKRNAGSGMWIAIALLTGLVGVAVYALTRIGDTRTGEA